ncbi:MAG: hypothetical protein LDL39_12245 [Magnetospirillum sp.]|nr:hypothetical protein [Magnetospirillum sp.]
MTRRFAPVVAALMALPFLASCSVLEKKEPPPCPPIYLLGDTASLTKYKPGKGRDLTDIEFQAEIQGYTGQCSYDEKGAIVEVQVIFNLTRGAADDDRKAKFDYFIAIPLYYPSPEAKAVFPVEVTFSEGSNYARHTDETVTMRVPVKDKDVIQKYEIYLGFQTSADELESNRKAKQ